MAFIAYPQVRAVAAYIERRAVEFGQQLQYQNARVVSVRGVGMGDRCGRCGCQGACFHVCTMRWILRLQPHREAVTAQRGLDDRSKLGCCIRRPLAQALTSW